MIYPVGNTGSKEEFERDWYVASGFGENRTTYFHEALDINLRSGGDSDLGKEIKAIASGRIIYYHYSSHPTSAFGIHLVYRINGAWGTRWIHCAHMSEQDFKGSVQDVHEGQIIGRIGKSGTQWAHLHFAIFKVDPATNGGFDNIANTMTELNNIWEDPLAFINQWMQAPAPSPVTDQSLYDFQGNIGIVELQRGRSIMREYESKINEQANRIARAKAELG